MTRIDMRQYAKIRHVGDRETEGILRCDALEVTEKVDGSNVRFMTHNGRLVFGSHTTVLGPYDDGTMRNNWKQFEPVIEHIKKTIKPEDLNPAFIYFGEDTSHPHTVKYESAPQWVGFDIMAVAPEGSIVQEVKGDVAFLSTAAKQREFERLGLPFIEPWAILKNPTLDDIRPYMRQTRYGTKLPEGIVIKNYARLNRWGRPLFAKLVNDDFKEVNRAVWSGVKRDQNCEREIVEAYITPARVMKLAQKLLAGELPAAYGPHEVIGKRMIPDLFEPVVEDILSEEIVAISKEWTAINFKDLKVAASKRIAQIIMEATKEP